MLKIILLNLLLLAGLFANSQTNTDSLLHIWNDINAHDTTRLNAIGIAAEEGYLFSDPNTAFSLFQQQYDFAKLKGLSVYMGHALNKQAFSYLIRSKYFYALDYYQQSLILRTEINDAYGIISSLNGIGIIYNILNDYEKSLEYYSQALKMNETLGNQRVNAGTTINIAGCYYELKEYNKALSLSTQAIVICEDIEEMRFLANGLDLRGNINHAIGETDKAISDFQRALNIFGDIGDNTGISECAGNFGALYNHIGEYQMAIDLCIKSLELSKAVESLREQKEACECLYNAYKVLGNEKKALAYHEKMLLAQEGLQKEDASKNLQQMEFAKKVLADSLIQEAEKLAVQNAHEAEVSKKNKTRNFLAVSGLLGLLLAGGFFSRWRYVKKSKAIIEKEKDRSENLLLNILPAEIAAELKENGEAAARDFDTVSILFTDFKEFTQLSEKLSASELVAEINYCFKAFDNICEKYKIEKIKTIGDSYMAAGGLPIPFEDSVKNTVLAALDMQAFIQKRKSEKVTDGQLAFIMRAGINTGPVVAGIVGVKKFQYDIWGDTVNTASRMESHGEVGQVNIAQSTYELIQDDLDFVFESRGKIQAKGKGEVEMYFVRRT